MGFERNNQILNLTNQISTNFGAKLAKFTTISQPSMSGLVAGRSKGIKVCYSTSSFPSDSAAAAACLKRTEKGKLHPDFVIGFTDGEGSFGISVSRNSKFKAG